MTTSDDIARNMAARLRGVGLSATKNRFQGSVRVVLPMAVRLPPILQEQVDSARARAEERARIRRALRIVLPAAEVAAIPDDQLEARWQAENARASERAERAKREIDEMIREMIANAPASQNRKARRAAKARRRR